VEADGPGPGGRRRPVHGSICQGRPQRPARWPAATSRPYRSASSTARTDTTASPRCCGPPADRYRSRACRCSRPSRSSSSAIGSATSDGPVSPRRAPDRARCRCWVAYRGPLPSPGRRSRGHERPAAASHAASWKTPPARRLRRLRRRPSHHLASYAQRCQASAAVRHVAGRIHREVPLVHLATAHRERDPRTRLALPHVVMPHTAALPERALPDPHRTPHAARLLLHVLRHHERPDQAAIPTHRTRAVRQCKSPPGHRRQGEPRGFVRKPTATPRPRTSCGLRLICAAIALEAQTSYLPDSVQPPAQSLAIGRGTQ
jgi:hypothetical protein